MSKESLPCAICSPSPDQKTAHQGFTHTVAQALARNLTKPTFSSLLVARDSHWTKGSMYSPMHGHEATTPALAAA
jgi:hypothetical protein